MKILRVLKKCSMPLAIAIILIAIVVSLFRALTPWAKQYKTEVEQHLSVMLGQPVSISDLETSWYWFQPVLKMKEVTLSDPEHRVLTLNKLLVGINLLSSLWHWQIEPGVLYASDVHLTLRQAGDRWDVDGLSNDKQSMSLESLSYLPILNWVLTQQKIIIKNASAELYFNDHSSLSIRDFNVTAWNTYQRYRVKGTATLDQKTPTSFLIMADAQLNPNNWRDITGHAHVSAERLLPAQWQRFFPNTPVRVQSGVGDVALWLDVVKGRFLSLQSTLDFNDLSVTHEGHSKRHQIDALTANLAWRTTEKGWQFTGDQLQWRVDGVDWPKNSALLDYNAAEDTYHAFLKKLPLESLFMLDVPWPEKWHDVLLMHPKGLLKDSQFSVKSGQIDSVLTRFSNLGWHGQRAIPSVDQLSGVLSWQPTDGRLQLDSEQATLTPNGLKPATFEQLNADVNWQQLSNGWRISLDRFILNRPDFVVSSSGTFDDPGLPTANLRMTAEYSIKHAERWLAYIPSNLMKPKLDAWVRAGVQRLNHASGRLVINGPLADFPFEQAQGEFSVNAYLDGLDLLFASHWPLARDVQAQLQWSNRALNANVLKANLQGIAVDNVNIGLHDVGLGHEALLIHGKVNAPAEQIKAYVLQTPIRTHLSSLKKMVIQDDVGLDLQLDIPLHPDDDHMLAKGALTFDNNPVVLHYGIHDIPLDGLSGTLQFNERGMTDSTLHAALAGEPLIMRIRSVKTPKPHTEATIQGRASVDLLRRKFALTLLERMDGYLDVNSVLQLTENPRDFDHMIIKTSMQGVSVDLPKPLGKTADEIAPLTLNVDFNATPTRAFGLQYKDLFVRAKTITNDKWSIQIKEQSMKADLQYVTSANALTGTIDQLNLAFALNRRKNTAYAALTPRDIPNLNLVINACFLDDIELGSIRLKSISTPTQLLLEDCTITSPEYALTMKGTWKKSFKKDNTHIDADLQLSDLGRALTRWHIMPAVEAHKGQVLFRGDWSGTISDFSLANVIGQMSIVVRNGRITHFDPSTEEKLGLGKLLSILSLQTIPRRLQLDFSDLSKGGYSFDVFKGNFVLNKGVLTTQDSYLDGPVAYASMKGDLDVVNHLYDLDLRVSPYIMASLPIVVTIAGGPVAGPIAGFATWVASKLINKGLQQISAYTYKISGPWLDPIVQQVHIYKKKNAGNVTDSSTGA